jgi:hypothetical protein
MRRIFFLADMLKLIRTLIKNRKSVANCGYRRKAAAHRG